MTELANLFVTPTAMRKFRDLLARGGSLTDAEIIEVIQLGCAATKNLKYDTRRDGRQVTYAQVRDVVYRARRYTFRAVILAPERDDGDEWPAVTDILPWGKPPRSVTTATRIAQRLRDGEPNAIIQAAGGKPNAIVSYIFGDGSGLHSRQAGHWEALPPEEVERRLRRAAANPEDKR